MRGLDLLAAACAPEQSATTPEGYTALSEEQCKKIAALVLEQLQGKQAADDTSTPEPATPEPDNTEEGGSEDAESEP